MEKFKFRRGQIQGLSGVIGDRTGAAFRGVNFLVTHMYIQTIYDGPFLY